MSADPRAPGGAGEDARDVAAPDVAAPVAPGEGTAPDAPPEATAEQTADEAADKATETTAGTTAAAPAPADGPAGTPPPADPPVPPAAGGPPGARRSSRRDPLAAVLIGVLTMLLGFAFAVQVRSNDTDQLPPGAREEDLVRILDDLTAQQDRLRQEIADQRTALDQLSSSDSASAAALQEARERAEALGILNGSVPAQGPGITMTVRDPQGRISSSVVLNAIEELRGAGAETMQVDGIRIGVSSAVTGTPGQLAIDGTPLSDPYVFQVIGSPQDMATAMSIPGGVVSTVGGRGGSVDVVQSERVVVDALRQLEAPQYAEPGDGD
jgi:uncharacterized protein YlxW (UPF0749 family)